MDFVSEEGWSERLICIEFVRLSWDEVGFDLVDDFRVSRRDYS